MLARLIDAKLAEVTLLTLHLVFSLAHVFVMTIGNPGVQIWSLLLVESRCSDLATPQHRWMEFLHLVLSLALIFL